MRECGYRAESSQSSKYARTHGTSTHVLMKPSSIPTVGFNMKRVQKGHVTLKWFVDHTPPPPRPRKTNLLDRKITAGI